MIDWKKNLKEFQYQMIQKIAFNFEEKGLSWRTMSVPELEMLISKYLDRKDYASVANIAFMLFENRSREAKK